MSDERIDVKFGAQIHDLTSGLRQAGTATKESVDQIKGHLEGLNATVKSLQAPFLAFAALLAGGEIFSRAIEHTNELGEQLKVMSQKTGMAVDDLSRLEYAAKMSDVSIDSLGVGLQKLARAMDDAQKAGSPAEATFERLGIRTADANGHLRPMRDVLEEIAERFAKMENGAGKTALAMQLFGRSGGALIPLLNEGKEGIAALEAEADRLGVTMSKEGVAAANEYDDAMKRFHATTQGLEQQLAIALMPALTDAANAFTGGSETASAFKAIMVVVADAVRVVSGSILATIGSLRALNTVLSADLTKAGDFAAAWKKAGEQMEETGIAVRRAFGQPLATDPKVAVLPKKSGGDEDAPAAASGLSKMEQLQLQWLAIRQKNREHLGEMTAMELAFWRENLGTVREGTKEYLQIRQRIDALEQTLVKDSYDAKLAALRVQEELDKEHLVDVIEDRKQELALIREHYAEASKEVQEGLRRVAEIENQMHKESAKEWASAFNAIPSAFGRATGEIGKSVLSLQDLFRTFFRDLGTMALETGAKSVRDHAATELAKKNITFSSVAARVAAESWGAIQSVALGAWAALKNIANYAATAIAAAWASISAIPVVGPFLAPAVAVGTGLAVLGLAGQVRSAAGGYDVPAGINPMTQLHAQEMVLPAELANVVRGMAKGGSGGGGRGGDVHIHAWDSKSLVQFAKDNPDAFGHGFAAAITSNHSGLNKALGKRG